MSLVNYKAIAVLEGARTRLTPDTWVNFNPCRSEPPEGLCLLLAIAEAGNGAGLHAIRDAKMMIYRAIGGRENEEEGFAFNDTPGRTLAEIHAKIDEAIALLRHG